MENYLKDFVDKYTGLVNQLQRRLISSKKLSLDHNTLNSLYSDMLMLEKACGLVNFVNTKKLALVLSELLHRLDKGGVVLDTDVSAAIKQSCDFIVKTLKQIKEDGQEPILKGYDTLLAQLESAAQPNPEVSAVEEESSEVTANKEVTVEVSANQRQEYIADFLQEGYEIIDEAESHILKLEEQPDNKVLIDSIFRIFHTIKGSCGIVGLTKTEILVHRSENLIGSLKTEKTAFSPDVSNLLFKIVDTLRLVFKELEQTQAEGDEDHQHLIQCVEELMKTSSEPVKSENKKTGQPKAEVKSSDTEHPQEQTKEKAKTTVKQKQQKPVSPPAEIIPDNNAVIPEQPLNQKSDNGFPVDDQTQDLDDTAIDRYKSSTSSVSDKTIRIDIKLLDKMMDQIGELVLNRNQIMQIASDENISSLNSSSQGLNLITSELQAMIMKSRMQPIKHLWDKFPRMVRDLSKSSGKKIKIVMQGAETELDRSLLEEIRDPLMHLVRNAIDHGIEKPEDRVKQGKSAEGMVVLKAFNEAGKVDIEITDDGKGINPDSIKQKALDKDLITSAQANQLSERETLDLIFMSGLSTAEKITNVSGRGVGMDVVKTNVEKIGGTININSRAGRGTTFAIKIPLTLVIIPVLLVTCGEEQYAIAQSNIVELVNLEGNQIKEEIELLHDVPVYRLREDLLPLVFLSELLGIQTQANQDRETLSLVVIRIGTRQYGLVVDEIYDSQEIVIKPLSKQLKNLKCYSGATIIGDGKVALVLDVLGIIQQAKLLSDEIIKQSHQNMNTSLESESAGSGNNSNKMQTLLLFEDLLGRHMAMPFSQATRLEEFHADAVEYVGDQYVVQYRSDIMPLVFIPAIPQADQSDSTGGEAVHVVVHTQDDRNIGLVVKNILDIVEEEIVVKGFSNDETIMFTTVIQGHVVEVLDVDKLLALKIPYLTKQMQQAEAELEGV